MDRFPEIADKALKAAMKKNSELQLEEALNEVREICIHTNERSKNYEAAMALYFADFYKTLSDLGGLQAAKPAPENFSFLIKAIATMHMAASSVEAIMTDLETDNK